MSFTGSTTTFSEKLNATPTTQEVLLNFTWIQRSIPTALLVLHQLSQHRDGPISRSERGSLGFVQWNESSTKHRDGRKSGGSRSNNTATKEMPKNKHKSLDFSSIAEEGVEYTGQRASSNIVANERRIVMSCLTPTPGLSTPPPPHSKPPQRKSHTKSPSVTPRRTPSDGPARVRAQSVHVQRNRNVGHTNTEGEHGDSEEHDEGDTSTPNPTRDNEGLIRTENPSGRTVAASSPTGGQAQERVVPGRHSAAKKDRSSPVSLKLVNRTNGIDCEHVDHTDDIFTGSMKSTLGLEPQTELGRDKSDAEVHATFSGVQFVMDTQIRIDPFVLNLMNRLAVLENSLRNKTTDVTAFSANESGRVTGPEAELDAHEIQQAEPVEAADPANIPGVVQISQEQEASKGSDNPKEVELETTGEGSSPAMKKSQASRKRMKRN